MSGNHIISAYEAMAAVTGEMREAAERGDWDRLTALERECASHLAKLAAGGRPALEGELRERKVELIRRILADDARIREITEPWMAKLQALLASGGRRQSLARSYGVAGGAWL